MQLSKHLIAATALWAASACLMAVDLLMPLVVDLGEMAVLVAIAACLPTGSLAVERIVQREHDRTIRALFELLCKAEVEGKLRHLR